VFAFALAAAFSDAPVRKTAAQLTASFPIHAADGVRSAVAPSAVAAIARWAVVRRDLQVEPSWDAKRRLLFAGDVRLYNRSELLDELGVAREERDCSDLELARRAYLRWDADAPLHLVGDFAFAAWNEDRRTLFAARDHLGLRPFFYSVADNALIVASDVRQMLALSGRTPEVNAPRILDFLLLRLSRSGDTFFSHVRRLRPGHRLTIRNNDENTTRYWLPPATTERMSYGENCEVLRALFCRAVSDRIESDRPIVAHSSGGFDSSTIIMAAAEIHRTHPGRAPLTLASAIVPGFPSDESHLMDAVAARVPFEGVRWHAIDETSETFPGVTSAGPLLQIGPAGGPRRDLDIARARGARVLLSGHMGDDVWYAADVLRDFVRHGRLTAPFRYISKARLGLSAVRPLSSAALGMLSPAIATRLSWWFARRPEPPPSWLGQELEALYPLTPEPLDLPPIEWTSHVACGVWLRLTAAWSAYLAELMTGYGADDGIEVRLPHADVRLIEHVLRMPWHQREPIDHNRRTGRESLGVLLPQEFAGRRGQRPWTPVWLANSRRTLKGAARFLDQGPWLSEPFVDRGIARAAARELASELSSSDFRTAWRVLAFAALEAWLRTVFG
jgi:asparagine synthase (glutamine-hydrolysing)